MAGFESTTKYKLIYIIAINDETHKGLLKIGEATIKTSNDPAKLVPNCSALNSAAKERIKGYTATAGISTQLLYTELALKTVNFGGAIAFVTFSDTDVHDVLTNSGKRQIKPNATDGNEWFEVDLDTAKNAINAVKEGRLTLTSAEITTTAPPIVLREEQNDAIAKTLECFKKGNEMLWYAKMRFGKTLTSLEVVRQAYFRRVIIVTHRPVVGSGWQEDFGKIFRASSDLHKYSFEFKKNAPNNTDYDETIDQQNDITINNLNKNESYFIYFASIQDLRGSKRVGGTFNKNNAVFDLEWDLIIVDEAHEGTQTDLGDAVIKALRKDTTKVLALSGTPFNILDQYEDESVFTWDYVMEQKRKIEWDSLHPGDHNPYADLPQMHIFTYDLGTEIPGYVEYELEGKAFNFREFFRTWTGDLVVDKRPVTDGKKPGEFLYEEDIRSFLNLITKADDRSLYPYSTQEYRDMFKHTLWMIPGVKEAKALSKMLRKHHIFRHFGIANVAGEGDTFEETNYDDALDLVRKTIKENDYSITLSCGKLTTGVTVKEWTAVLMLAGSYSTSAAGYMQTIFRVQSAGQIDGMQKTDCYVFDFAPDRTLKVLAETANVSRKAGKTGKDQDSNRDVMSNFINFCPVIAIQGTEMKPYSVSTMMEQLKRVYAEKAIKSGFEDASIYNDNLMRMDELDIKLFDKLKGVVGASKAAPPLNDVEINAQGFTEEEHEKAERAKKKPKVQRTPEEIEALKKLQEQRKNRDKAISILRGVSIRMPLMIYGADVSLDEDISIDRFVNLVDETSWKEFMPIGVTKELFKDFLKYYDRDVFISAGKEIRKLAANADGLSPTQRVNAIAKVFRYFKNPDKETVLTPWRVVNMHISNILGGWCFFDEAFNKMIDVPRLVDQGKVTADTFKNPNAKVMEINSKSGLYPLYVTYSIYRAKLGKQDENQISADDQQALWSETLRDNVFIICKTPMAKSITQRTLTGYSGKSINAHCFDDLVKMLKSKPEQFRKKVTRGSYWGREVKEMKFDAIVGNPPYQVMDGGNAASSLPIYQEFVDQSTMINPKYVSMITPSRWFTGGRNLDSFRDKMLHDDRLRVIHDYPTASDCFQNVEIKGGINYFLWDRDNRGKCMIFSHNSNSVQLFERNLIEDGLDTLIRNEVHVTVLKKVSSFSETSFSSILNAGRFFGFHTKVNWYNNENGSIQTADGKSTIPISSKQSKEFDIKLYIHGGECWIAKSNVPKNQEVIESYKIIIPRSGNPGSTILGKPKLSEPNSCSSNTYIVVIPKNRKMSIEEANNMMTYIKTKFFRFLVAIKTATQDMPPKAYSFVPIQDFSKSWSDAELNKKYGLTDDEIEFIESAIKPME